MHKTMLTLVAMAVVLGLSARAADKQDQELFNKRIHEVNNTAKKRNMIPTALKHISVETGVPLAEVESMHKSHPGTGAAGMLIACVLADETKKPPEEFLRQHEKGKSWAAIAHDHQVPLDKLSARLDRLEATFANANAGRSVEKKQHK